MTITAGTIKISFYIFFYFVHILKLFYNFVFFFPKLFAFSVTERRGQNNVPPLVAAVKYTVRSQF